MDQRHQRCSTFKHMGKSLSLCGVPHRDNSTVNVHVIDTSMHRQSRWRMQRPSDIINEPRDNVTASQHQIVDLARESAGAKDR
jgi:hypothetical protein